MIRGVSPPPLLDRFPAEYLRQLPGVPCCQRVSATLLRGGQPTRAGLLSLKRIGVRTVVNLRVHHDMGMAAVSSHGMDYLRIPIELNTIDDGHVECFVGVATDPERVPVFVHCQHGIVRTGLLVAVYRMAVQGWTATRAVGDLIRTVGSRGRGRDFRVLREYVMRLDVESLRRRLGIRVGRLLVDDGDGTG